MLTKLAPTVLQVFEKIPGEALKHVIARFKDMSPSLRGSLGNQANVDRVAIASLKQVQSGIENARRTAGIRVEGALKGFQNVVKGKAVVDTTPVAQALDDALAAAQMGDEAVAAAAGQTEMHGAKILPGELQRLSKVTDAIRKSPLKTPEQAIALRRALDDLTAFKRGAVPPVSSGVGQRAVKSMGASLRESIQAAAEAAGYTPLAKANAEFNGVVRLYDEAGEVFAVKSISDMANLAKLEKLSSMFYAGGLKKEILQDMAARIPHGAKPVNDLLDAIAVRAFEKPPQGTPSGTVLNVIRVLGAPRLLGAGIRGAYKIEPVLRPLFPLVRPSAQAGVAATDAALTSPPRR